MIVWVHPHAHNENVASVRLNALLPAKFISGPEDATVIRSLADLPKGTAEIIICMAPQDVDAAITTGCKVIAFQSDGPLLTPKQYQRVDAIVCDSTYLKTRVPAIHWQKTFYCNDALEHDEDHKPRKHRKQPLRFLWLGAQGNYRFASKTIDHLRSLGHKVEVMSDGLFATIPWERANYIQKIVESADVGIVAYPQDLVVVDDGSYNNFRYKDNCRTVLFQSLGIPVIASPLPSLLQYIDHLQTGLIANSPQDWENCAQALQTDDLLYEYLATYGLQQSRGSRATSVASQWLTAIDYVRST